MTALPYSIELPYIDPERVDFFFEAAQPFLTEMMGTKTLTADCMWQKLNYRTLIF
jgi:hypothetical protein